MTAARSFLAGAAAALGLAALLGDPRIAGANLIVLAAWFATWLPRRRESRAGERCECSYCRASRL